MPDPLLPNTWIVVRVDGRGFTKMCAKYGFEKPNDRRALDLMNTAAKAVVTELPEITIAYGVSDEYSFVFHKACTLFDRRASKLVSTVVSTFTANYVYFWSTHFPDSPLSPPLPSFDGRAVCYPSVQNLRDYMSWRQADCHINNLYNTCFWSLIQLGGLDNKEAESTLAVGGHIAELEQADCISAHWQQTKTRYSSPAFPSTTTTSPRYTERGVLSSAITNWWTQTLTIPCKQSTLKQSPLSNQSHRRRRTRRAEPKLVWWWNTWTSSRTISGTKDRGSFPTSLGRFQNRRKYTSMGYHPKFPLTSTP